MSTSVPIVLGALLIAAGAVSITAAAVGNPIRIGRTSVPGPETAVERAVIALVGAIRVAAVIPVFLVGKSGAHATPLTAAGATGTPDPSITVDPSPTPSPEPAPGPSAVTATSDGPVVTSISVAGGPAPACTRTFTASVRVNGGPVNVVYRAFVDGVPVGSARRAKQISGTGLRTLDAVTITADHGGTMRVRFDVINPNPSLLTGTATWDAPPSCAPVVAPPATTATPPAPSAPTLGISIAVPPSVTGACDVNGKVGVIVTGHLEIGPGASATVTWTVVASGGGPSQSNTVTTSSDISATLVLVPGDYTMSLSANSPATNPTAPTPVSGSVTVTCSTVP